jgi:hypothetical protein
MKTMKTIFSMLMIGMMLSTTSCQKEILAHPQSPSPTSFVVTKTHTFVMNVTSHNGILYNIYATKYTAGYIPMPNTTWLEVNQPIVYSGNSITIQANTGDSLAISVGVATNYPTPQTVDNITLNLLEAGVPVTSPRKNPGDKVNKVAICYKVL